jgi:hypothetical protein
VAVVCTDHQAPIFDTASSWGESRSLPAFGHANAAKEHRLPCCSEAQSAATYVALIIVIAGSYSGDAQ